MITIARSRLFIDYVIILKSVPLYALFATLETLNGEDLGLQFYFIMFHLPTAITDYVILSCLW